MITIWYLSPKMTNEDGVVVQKLLDSDGPQPLSRLSYLAESLGVRSFQEYSNRRLCSRVSAEFGEMLPIIIELVHEERNEGEQYFIFCEKNNPQHEWLISKYGDVFSFVRSQ